MNNFLITLIKNSISMSILVLIYLAITPLFSKRYIPKWRYYAWLIIVIGFIVPFRLSLEIPLLESSTIISPPNIQQMIPMNTSENIAQAEKISLVSGNWCIGIWIVGVIGFIAYHIIRHHDFLRMVKRWGEEATESAILEVLSSLQEELKIFNQVKLLYCSCITTPMMIGFINPVILLPSKNIPIDEISFILKHELIHFKRKDLWYKGLVFLATSIHWFNPIVYLMAKEIAVECEISCDAEVVKGTDIDKRQQYIQAIISVIKNGSRVQTSFSTNFYGGKKGIKNRILSIMDMKKKRTGILIFCLMIIGVMITGVTITENISMESIEDSASLNDLVEDVNVMSYLDEETGETSYSWDDDVTWISLTDEEYEAKFPTSNIEWWTYDEYKEWLDIEKVQLQDIIGERSWNPTEGWYVWTQEKVDETIQMYERILEDIGNGVMYSKSINGDENISISQDYENIKADILIKDSFSIENNRE